MKDICLFFHHWSPWADCTWGKENGKMITSGAFGARMRQARMCSRCGLEQVRLVPFSGEVKSEVSQ